MKREQLSSRFFMSKNYINMEKTIPIMAKKKAVIALFVLASFPSIAQDTITVMENTFKIKGGHDESHIITDSPKATK